MFYREAEARVVTLRSMMERDATRFCQRLKEEYLVEHKDGGAVWRMLAITWDIFCHKYLGVSAKTVDAMLAAYEAYQPDEVKGIRLGIESAKSLSRPEIASHGNASNIPIPGPGRGHKKEQKQVDNVNSLLGNEESKGGNRTTYLTDRLRTQHPEVFTAMSKGEYPSVHSAAVAAGIRKPMAQHVATPEGFAKAARKHLNEEERQELIRLLL